jgi:hypothetical protein
MYEEALHVGRSYGSSRGGALFTAERHYDVTDPGQNGGGRVLSRLLRYITQPGAWYSPPPQLTSMALSLSTCNRANTSVSELVNTRSASDQTVTANGGWSRWLQVDTLTPEASLTCPARRRTGLSCLPEFVECSDTVTGNRGKYPDPGRGPQDCRNQLYRHRRELLQVQ